MCSTIGWIFCQWLLKKRLNPCCGESDTISWESIICTTVLQPTAAQTKLVLLASRVWGVNPLTTKTTTRKEQFSSVCGILAFCWISGVDNTKLELEFNHFPMGLIFFKVSMFRYSEKTTKIWKYFPLFWNLLVGDFFQIFAAFSEYLNCTKNLILYLTDFYGLQNLKL